MNYILISINYALMIVIPIVVAVFIYRRTGAGWRFFLMGAATFILSQVLHIPFNWAVQQSGVLPGDTATWANLLIVAVFLGLSAGVFEETARYLTYRFWAKDARSWSRGMMLGAGHGGIEAILLGLLAAVGFVGLLVTANNELAMDALGAEGQQAVTDALSQITDVPWYMMLLGALERAFTILAHLAMSVMVLQVFLRGAIRWLFLSIGFHTLLNATVVVVATRYGPLAAEGALAVLTLLSVYIIFRLRTPDPVAPEPPPLPEPVPGEEIDLPSSAEALDRSRYN